MARDFIVLVLCVLVSFVKSQTDAPQDVEGMATTQTSSGEEVLQFSDITLAVILDRLAAANLPHELELTGERIIADAAEGLELCAENLAAPDLIWQYKVCAASQLRNALAAVAALQVVRQQPPTSAAQKRNFDFQIKL